MIETWMKNFKEAWINHDVKGVMSLFFSNVVYYETPFLKLTNLDDVEKEWRVVSFQKKISFDYEVFSSAGNKHTILWSLSYESVSGECKELKGTYLVELNDEGKCVFFHHCCEENGA